MSMKTPVREVCRAEVIAHRVRLEARLEAKDWKRRSGTMGITRRPRPLKKDRAANLKE